MSKALNKAGVKTNVAFCKVKDVSRDSIISTVENVIKLTECVSLISARKIFLKVNLLSQEVVPGQCTSPWVFEGVLRYLHSINKCEIFYGDADVAAATQVERAVKNWGIKAIGDHYRATFVNLSKAPKKRVCVGPILGEVEVPALLLDMDAIITNPVIKTHCITPFTGALKNQWGLLPRVRFQYHSVVHEAIAEINRFFIQLLLGVADLTVAMEGPGPRVGRPKICNLIMASGDLVSLDAAIARYMGLDPFQVGFIRHSEELGVGTTSYQVVGDRFEVNPFKLGLGKDYLVYRWRDRLVKVPLVRKLVLKVWVYRLLGYLATKYTLWFWHRRLGRGYAKAVCTETNYGKEFQKLIEATDR